MEYIAFDAHKRYTLASVVRPDGRLVREQRIAHERGALREFLERCERGSPVAVETIGNWYWIVDEIEAAGCVPKLVHARKAKLMMGEINKTDQARRAGAQPAAAGRDAADGLDSARRIAGPAGPAAHPDGARPAADAAQESDSRHLGQVRPPRPRGERSLRRARPGAPAAAPRRSCRRTRRTPPSNCSSRSRRWTARCASLSSGSRPPSSRPR